MRFNHYEFGRIDIDGVTYEHDVVIGTGAQGRLPVMDDVTREARDRRIERVVLRTEEAIKVLEKHPKRTNAVLHITC